MWVKQEARRIVELMGARADALVAPLRVPKDRILSATSRDGRSWKRDPGFRIDVRQPEPFEDEMVYGCCVRKLADNSFEMYYQASVQINNRWHSRIKRAASVDGLVWVESQTTGIEGGISPVVANRVQSPLVVMLLDSELMFFSGDDSSGTSRIFRAKKGLEPNSWGLDPSPILSPEQFLRTDGRRVTALVDPSIARMRDGTYRMYVSAVLGSSFSQEIMSAWSADGSAWHPDSGVRIEAGGRGYSEVANNPSVIDLGDRFLMLFRGADNLPLWCDLFASTSIDGIDWTQPKLALRHSKMSRGEGHGIGFPYVMHCGDYFRMYYTGYWGNWLCQDTVRNHVNWHAQYVKAALGGPKTA